MTVRRHAEKMLDAPESIVVDAVRSVLARKPYCNSRELENGARFLTNVKPGWWLLSTEMMITARPSLSHAGRTHLAADTKSQWYVLGDIYGYYNEYLGAFLKDVQAAASVRAAAPAGGERQSG